MSSTMFRRAVGKAAAGTAGAAAVASPSTSQCYSRPSSRNTTPHTSQSLKDSKPCEQADEPWCLVFGEDEVRDTVQTVLGYTPQPQAEALPATSIEEIRDGQEDGSPDSQSEAASSYLMQADQRMVSHASLQDSFGSSLLTLLNDRGVQHACFRALKDDPTFSEMLTELETGAPMRASSQSVESLIPRAAQAAERLQLEAPPTVVLEPDLEASLKDFLDGIAGRVQSIGDSIKGAWDAAGAAVGNGILRVGYTISQLWGRPGAKTFHTGSSEEYTWGVDPDEPPSKRPETLGKAMMSVAMVVFMLLVFKRFVRPL